MTVLGALIEPSPDGVLVHAAEVQDPLRELGFYKGPDTAITGRSTYGKEWDADTISAFDRWARETGLDYVLEPDPDPIDATFPRSFMMLSPFQVLDELFKQGQAGDPIEVPAAGGAVPELRIEGSKQPVLLVLAGAVGLVGLAWAVGSSAPRRKRRVR